MNAESDSNRATSAPAENADGTPVETVPVAEALAQKVPNKALLLAIAFGLALLVGAAALLVGLNKL